MKVFNTLSKQKEEFIPLDGNRVRMYVCGITVYDYCHLGHARMLVAFDVIARWLRHRGYDLTYVKNITDIEDKILKRAVELNEPFRELTERFIGYMHEDEKALGIEPPDIEPRATQYIDSMKSMIATLIENGSAYAVDNGDVYFAVNSFAGYGKLSGKKPDELLEGARVEVGELKRDPRDFALWKGANPSEPADAHFEAPWGKGRPGWHIECSVMSTDNLGDSFDIHGGGQDLVFPHHENEIAQSEAASHQHYAKYWLHNNAVRVDQVKMSKSLNNFFTIRDILQKYDAEWVRYFLVATQYRTPINYSEDSLKNAGAALERIYLALLDVDWQKGDSEADDSAAARTRFSEAMDDDFNTPEAMAVIFDLVRQLNIAKKDGKRALAENLAAAIRALGKLLGIAQREPMDALRAGDVSAAEAGLSDEDVETLVAEREAAKIAKDYSRADQIRQDLAEQGVVLEDSREGTRWRRK
ncbi:MAG: cysteine--tRNA ligase [Pseudomonadales bacterium]